ncbi:MAG: hypothetical protein A4E33_01778 [Methanoregula sp. PtaB.Bin085]|nr:MAG: hypothetical protein A4E33_01778 [Methanoregula sp. PtaB.Bin085]
MPDVQQFEIGHDGHGRAGILALPHIVRFIGFGHGPPDICNGTEEIGAARTGPAVGELLNPVFPGVQRGNGVLPDLNPVDKEPGSARTGNAAATVLNHIPEDPVRGPGLGIHITDDKVRGSGHGNRCRRGYCLRALVAVHGLPGLAVPAEGQLVIAQADTQLLPAFKRITGTAPGAGDRDRSCCRDRYRYCIAVLRSFPVRCADCLLSTAKIIVSHLLCLGREKAGTGRGTKDGGGRCGNSEERYKDQNRYSIA